MTSNDIKTTQRRENPTSIMNPKEAKSENFNPSTEPSESHSIPKIELSNNNSNQEISERELENLSNQVRNSSYNLHTLQSMPENVEEGARLADILKYTVIPGAIGGLGSVLLELKGIDLETKETIGIQADQSNYSWIPALSGKPRIMSLDFILYLMISLGVGAISGFLLTFYTIGLPDAKNRWRIVSSAILFGLLFPATTSFLYQSFLRQAENNNQEELVGLQQENEELAEEVKQSIDDLAQTYEQLIDISYENPEYRMEAIRNLGGLAVDNINRRPESVQLIQDILEKISQEHPDPAVREEADIQMGRITLQGQSPKIFPIPLPPPPLAPL